MNPTRIILLTAVGLSAFAVALAAVISMSGPLDQCSLPRAELARGWQCDAELTGVNQP